VCFAKLRKPDESTTSTPGAPRPVPVAVERLAMARQGVNGRVHRACTLCPLTRKRARDIYSSGRTCERCGALRAWWSSCALQV
jgi:hypothetical protein